MFGNSAAKECRCLETIDLLSEMDDEGVSGKADILILELFERSGEIRE